MMRHLLLIVVKFYQMFLSPLKGPTCRFYPSCSQYTYDAISSYGPYKGLIIGLRRLLRCHPFHPGGYDPLSHTHPLDKPNKME